MPVVDPGAIVTQNEGPSNLCWDVSVGECVIAAGGTSDVNALYQAVKGIAYVAPGQPATFAELIHAVTWAAAANGWQVQWYGADGRINDFGTFQSVVSAGQYYVIAGIKGQALNLGNFGHFEAVKGLYTAPDGTLMVTVADSYAAYDNAGWQPSYPLSEYLAAMAANWDPNADAIGFRFVVPASTAPAAPASVAAPAPVTPASIPADEQAAYAYFTQTKLGVDRQHAIWSACLLPMYAKYQAMHAANDPLASLFNPGPIAGPETGYRWGGIRPASIIRLSNMVVGTYLDTDGTWKPFRPEGA